MTQVNFLGQRPVVLTIDEKICMDMKKTWGKLVDILRYMGVELKWEVFRLIKIKQHGNATVPSTVRRVRYHKLACCQLSCVVHRRHCTADGWEKRTAQEQHRRPAGDDRV